MVLINTLLFFLKGSDVQTSREPEQSATADGNEIDTKQKPKKLAGAVSLFGGINPLAAKKNLRSASKEEAKCRFDVTD